MLRAIKILLTAAIFTLFAGAASAADVVKKSSSGICHDTSSAWYEKTRNFEPFDTLTDCLDSGGRLPKSYSPSAASSQKEAPSKAYGWRSGIPEYDRSLFGNGWATEGGSCLNTRHRLLAELSIIKPKFSRNGCYVAHGKWYDPYTDKTFTNPRSLDVDHLYPAYLLWQHGAYLWSEEKRIQAYNDPTNLIPVESSTNREKGARGPLEWLPQNTKYQCQYIVRFLRVAKKYDIQNDYISKTKQLRDVVCQ